MKLIKAGNLQHSSVVAYNRGALEDFPERALAVEEAVQEEVLPEEEQVDLEALRAEVMEAARQEAAVLVQQAYQEGLRRGEEAGRAAFEAQVAGVAELVGQAAEAMRATRAAFIDSLEPQVIELVALVARRVLQREMASDPELLHKTIRRALAKLADRQTLVVRLHPGDVHTLREQRVALLEDFGGVEELEIIADESILQGSCVVDSKTMRADARLDVLLEDVLAQLWG